MKNYDFGSTPTKSFSAYGANSNIKNIDMHNSNKKEKLSELDAAIEIARAYHEKKNALKAPVDKLKTSDFTKLGDDERTEIVKNVENDQRNKKKRVTFKTDEELKQNLEKAKEQNSQMASKFDQNSKTEDILNGVLNDLF